MGGSLEVESKVGSGSVFRARVTVPAARDDALERPVEPRGRALILDPCETSRNGLAQLLERRGYDVVCPGEWSRELARSCAAAFIDVRLHAFQEGPAIVRMGPAARRPQAPAEQLYLVKPVRPAALDRILAALSGVVAPPTDTMSLTPIDGAPRVLVVEDNPVNRRLTERLLERMGCPATVVENGRAAVDAVCGRPFDVVLMDIHLPGMDGIEATRLIRRRAAYQPAILALTADARAEEARRCLEAGMDEFLTKPLRPEALREALCRHAQSAAAGRRA